MERSSVFMIRIYDGVREPRHDVMMTCKEARTSATSASRPSVRLCADAALGGPLQERAAVGKLPLGRICQEVRAVFFAARGQKMPVQFFCAHPNSVRTESYFLARGCGALCAGVGLIPECQPPSRVLRRTPSDPSPASPENRQPCRCDSPSTRGPSSRALKKARAMSPVNKRSRFFVNAGG